METVTKNIKEPIVDRYEPRLDTIKAEDYFLEKLAKAKESIRKHGLPSQETVDKAIKVLKKSNC